MKAPESPCRTHPKQPERPPVFEFSLGLRYVVDGASFGAKALSSNIHGTLGFDAEHGAGFFAGGTIDVVGDWRQLTAWLEGLESAHERDRAKQAAVETFSAIERFLDSLVCA